MKSLILDSIAGYYAMHFLFEMKDGGVSGVLKCDFASVRMCLCPPHVEVSGGLMFLCEASFYAFLVFFFVGKC